MLALVLIASIAAFTRFSVRPVMITRAPSRASPRAMANPIPAVEPVTKADLPLSSKSMVRAKWLFDG